VYESPTADWLQTSRRLVGYQLRHNKRYVPDMRAVVIHETGAPEVLRVEEVPEPEPAEGQVIVRVEAAGINRFDLGQRAGGASNLPLVMSSFGVAAGERVDTGERVVATGARGNYADLTVAPEAGLTPLPDEVDAAVAAAFATPYPTAWWGLVGRAGLTAGDVLLVQGGASSTGQAAIDIGRLLDAAVYATASERGQTRVRELGAEALDYDDPRLAELGANVIFDPLGARTFGLSLEALGRDGRLVTPGAVGDPDVSFSIWTLVGKRARIEGISGQDAPADTMEHLVRLLAAGDLHPWVERELPLEQAAEAHRLIESGEVVGRVVLRP
jgi:NADPH:quinone reductase-like Zn-dependent oxidoreductase